MDKKKKKMEVKRKAKGETDDACVRGENKERKRKTNGFCLSLRSTEIGP